MDIPDILKIIIFEDFLKIAKKGPPKNPIGALLGFYPIIIIINSSMITIMVMMMMITIIIIMMIMIHDLLSDIMMIHNA